MLWNTRCMADDPSAKRVVKRVVKRVETSSSPTKDPAPTVRYGRPVAPAARAETPARRRRPAPVADQPAPSGVPDEPGTVLAEPIAAPRRSPVRRPSVPRVDLGSARQRLGSAGTGVAGAGQRAGTAVANAFWWVVDGVRGWRLPRLDAVPAALLTGAFTGLVSVLLGLGALQVFSWLRGVASGGGTWGSLTFVVVAFVAFVLGELLLSAFGTPSPRLTSFLGVVVTIVVILGVYLDEADTRLALLLVPAIAATSFTIAHWLMAAAESAADAPE